MVTDWSYDSDLASYFPKHIDLQLDLIKHRINTKSVLQGFKPTFTPAKVSVAQDIENFNAYAQSHPDMTQKTLDTFKRVQKYEESKENGSDLEKHMLNELFDVKFIISEED